MEFGPGAARAWEDLAPLRGGRGIAQRRPLGHGPDTAANSRRCLVEYFLRRPLQRFFIQPRPVAQHTVSILIR